MERIVVIQDGSLHLQQPPRTMRQMSHDSEVGYRRWHALTAEQLETYRTAPPSAWQIFADDVRDTALSLRCNPFYTIARHDLRARIYAARTVCALMSDLASLASVKHERVDPPVSAVATIRVADCADTSHASATLAAARRAARDRADLVKVISPQTDALARSPAEWPGTIAKLRSRRSRLHIQEARRNAGEIWRIGDTPIHAIGVVNEAIGMADRALGYGKVSV